MGILVNLLGGLALFLYGMNVLATGLEKTVGDQMKRFIESFTSNRVMGVIVGAIVTMIVQSSSATTVMIVGFVNSGIMPLINAVGIIMGANIGTTFTTQLISFDLISLVPITVGIGVWIWLFSSDRKTKSIGEILIGFGVLFIGIDYMKNASFILKESQNIYNLINSFGIDNITDNLLALLLGFAITAMIQSSSATIALLIALGSQEVITIEWAFPIILGANIGTCTTALISSVGANKTAKRSALIHFLFNLFGALIFVLILTGPTVKIMTTISKNPARQIANMHTFFNIVNTMIFIPFAPVLVSIVNKIIPFDPNEGSKVPGIKYLDDRILEAPSIAMVQVMKEVLHMGNIVIKSYNNAIASFLDLDEQKAKNTFELEKIINDVEKDIASYLLKISNEEISAEQREIIDGLFSTINDIERVGDHADNLAELAIYRIENRLKFSTQALDDLKVMGDWVLKSYKESLTALKTGDLNIAKRVVEREKEINIMEKTLRANHISRLSGQKCTPASAVIFLDIISNLERIADHASNIALSVLDIRNNIKN